MLNFFSFYPLDVVKSYKIDISSKLILVLSVHDVVAVTHRTRDYKVSSSMLNCDCSSSRAHIFA